MWLHFRARSAAELSASHDREEETEEELKASSKKAAQTVVGGITGLQVRAAPMRCGPAFRKMTRLA